MSYTIPKYLYYQGNSGMNGRSCCVQKVFLQNCEILDVADWLQNRKNRVAHNKVLRQ